MSNPRSQNTKPSPKEKRQQSSRRQNYRFFIIVWRTLFLGSFATLILWFLTRPLFNLTAAKQITVVGNKILSDESIRARIGLDYPQSIMVLEPKSLEQVIERESVIAEAVVTRQLFPTRLRVSVAERYPVARSPRLFFNSSATTRESGFLDADGKWLPENIFQSPEQDIKLPTLEVVGMRELQQSQWAQIYPYLEQSPVNIVSLDWGDSENLILHTEIAEFHLGANQNQLEAQLQAIARLKDNLSQTINMEKVTFIDIKHPEEPIIQYSEAAITPEPS